MWNNKLTIFLPLHFFFWNSHTIPDTKPCTSLIMHAARCSIAFFEVIWPFLMILASWPIMNLQLLTILNVVGNYHKNWYGCAVPTWVVPTVIIAPSFFSSCPWPMIRLSIMIIMYVRFILRSHRVNMPQEFSMNCYIILCRLCNHFWFRSEIFDGLLRMHKPFFHSRNMRYLLIYVSLR
jgi:hypothetical protein